MARVSYVAAVVLCSPVLSCAVAAETLAVNAVVEVPANPGAGFSFPYCLFVPDTAGKPESVRLLVEPNNTGTATDDFEVHRQMAWKSAKSSYPNKLARELGAPLLVPVFPRPRSGWQTYTHSLDRDTLEIEVDSTCSLLP